MLLLGRLDGRLHSSPFADIWMARARLRGAAALAGLAGAPVGTSELQDWLCGRTGPPRASEGLNDPISVAAVFHFALRAEDSAIDPLAKATLRVLRTVLDDRQAGETWGADDLLLFGPAWRRVSRQIALPYSSISIADVANRLYSIWGELGNEGTNALTVQSVDGRPLVLNPRIRSRAWILAAHLPCALFEAGLTTRALPSLVSISRFMPRDEEHLHSILSRGIATCCREGLADLNWIEKDAPARFAHLNVTKRSHAHELVRLEMSYPGLKSAAIARLLGLSVQGAAKLRRTLQSSSEKKGESQRVNGLSMKLQS